MITGGPSFAVSFHVCAVIDEERDGFARGVFVSVVPGVSVTVLLSPVSSRGVTPPKMDDSRGAFVVRDGAGVAPPVPLTLSFLLICGEV